MKNLIFSSIILFVLGLISCESLEEIRENPNNVSESHPQLLLTNIEWNAFQVESPSPQFASRMLVQSDGEDVYQYYKWDRGSYYEYNRLRDVTKMMEEARRIESPSYVALAKFFRAYYFYQLTITYGDIPYSEALKGESEEIYSPVYDSQKNVFIGILKELKEASDSIPEDVTIPGDIIYGGNPVQWKKLINSFRLKVLITLSKKESDTDLDVAQTFANIIANEPIMESLDDNGQLNFFDQLGSRYTEFNESGYGSARYVDSTFIQRLQDREDPRLFIYCGQTRLAKEAGKAINDFTAYEGGNPVGAYEKVNDKAIEGKVSKVNLRYTTDPTTEPHMFLGFPEVQFILAEASVRGWINSDAKMYYDNGIKASFAFYNMYAENYSSHVDEAAANNYLTNSLVDFDQAESDNEKIERIITQKYLQSFLQGGWNVYFEHLRTGYPDFLLPSGNTPPTRWIYPFSEYLENEENVEAAITRQFGAGNDKTREVPWWLE
jgi:hypothetical protein